MKLSVFKYFYPEQPTLVHRDQELVEQFSDDPNYVAEIKYNGQRLELWMIDGEPLFYGRHGELLKYHFDPSEEIVKELKEKFPKGMFLFDSELRHNKVTGIRDKIVLWDCFIYNNQLLYKEPYWARREYLKKHFTLDGDPIALITQYKDCFRELFNAAIEHDEYEGLVMKNLQGKLNLGRKSGPASTWMFKIRKETGRHKF